VKDNLLGEVLDVLARVSSLCARPTKQMDRDLDLDRCQKDEHELRERRPITVECVLDSLRRQHEGAFYRQPQKRSTAQMSKCAKVEPIHPSDPESSAHRLRHQARSVCQFGSDLEV
jgi:hypothetical protein